MTGIREKKSSTRGGKSAYMRGDPGVATNNSWRRTAGDWPPLLTRNERSRRWNTILAGHQEESYLFAYRRGSKTRGEKRISGVGVHLAGEKGRQ